MASAVAVRSASAAAAAAATAATPPRRSAGAPVFAISVGGLAGPTTTTRGSGRLLRSDRFLQTRQRSVTRNPPNVVSPSMRARTAADTVWRIKREFLLQAKVRSVTPREALRLQKYEGYYVLDVRPEGDYRKGHPADALNAQVYRLIKGWSFYAIYRRVFYAVFFQIFNATEENPEFVSEVKAMLDEDAKIIVACKPGGTLKTNTVVLEGLESRSLIAAYLLGLQGFTNLHYIEGGLKEWFKQGLPKAKYRKP